MLTDDFIRRASETRQDGSSRRDTTALREALVRRFDRIHASIECEHAPGEALVLADAILRLDVAGPVIECGCFKGGMTAKLSSVCNLTGRELYACDSFRGLPAPAAHGGCYRHFSDRDDVVAIFGTHTVFREGEYAGALEEVQAAVSRFGDCECVRYLPGWFAETLPTLDVCPALVTMDVDLIESARDCIRHLWPRLAGTQFFTHEAFIQTYMDGILDPDWWNTVVGEPAPFVLGRGSGLSHSASCTAVLVRELPLRPLSPASRRPQKIAFVHLMRTAGTFLNGYLTRELRTTHRLRISWFAGLQRDWTAAEVQAIAAATEPTLLHNHVVSWTPNLLRQCRSSGFFIFMLIRHVGDQLCSLHRFACNRNEDARRLSVDEFVSRQLDGETLWGLDHRHWAIPEWWHHADFVGPISAPSLQQLVSDCLGIDWDPETVRTARGNASGSQTFQDSCDQGLIHSRTREKLLNSVFFRRYRAACVRIRGGE